MEEIYKMYEIKIPFTPKQIKELIKNLGKLKKGDSLILVPSNFFNIKIEKK